MKILITGAAGYIGTMITNRLLNTHGVPTIIAVDLLPKPIWAKNRAIIWIQADLATNDWQKNAAQYGPFDVVIHAAFKIRSPYRHIKETAENNFNASKNTFEFCFTNNAKKLIYLSSVAVYGAKQENIGKLLKETDLLAENKNPYGLQKKDVEENLVKIIQEKNPLTKTVIIRLNSVTGPIGQSLKSKFGLITILKNILPFTIETNPNWARQFVHEKDVEEALFKLTTEYQSKEGFEIFNLAPSDILTAKNIAKMFDKRVIKIPAWLVKPAFTAIWHLLLGRISCPPGSENGLIYPINVDGSKIKQIGFDYKYSAKDALVGKL